jgi:hypothetical protein
MCMSSDSDFVAIMIVRKFDLINPEVLSRESKI